MRPVSLINDAQIVERILRHAERVNTFETLLFMKPRISL